jgi:hypothetical protein
VFNDLIANDEFVWNHFESIGRQLDKNTEFVSNVSLNGRNSISRFMSWFKGMQTYSAADVIAEYIRQNPPKTTSGTYGLWVELLEKLKYEIMGELREELEDEVREELREELEYEVKAELKAELEDKVKAKLNEELDDEVW